MSAQVANLPTPFQLKYSDKMTSLSLSLLISLPSTHSLSISFFYHYIFHVIFFSYNIFLSLGPFLTLSLFLSFPPIIYCIFDFSIPHILSIHKLSLPSPNCLTLFLCVCQCLSHSLFYLFESMFHLISISLFFYFFFSVSYYLHLSLSLPISFSTCLMTMSFCLYHYLASVKPRKVHHKPNFKEEEEKSWIWMEWSFEEH